MTSSKVDPAGSALQPASRENPFSWQGMLAIPRPGILPSNNTGCWSLHTRFSSPFNSKIVWKSTKKVKFFFSPFNRHLKIIMNLGCGCDNSLGLLGKSIFNWSSERYFHRNLMSLDCIQCGAIDGLIVTRDTRRRVYLRFSAGLRTGLRNWTSYFKIHNWIISVYLCFYDYTLGKC